MKCDFQPRTADLGLLLAVLGIYLVAPHASALTGESPYSAIVGRNVFGLKPPTRVEVAPPPPAAAATTVKLQGFCTILDRRQVLLKVMTAARPPEPAKEKCYTWSEGQGEDDIEVLEINAVAGTVRIKNHDSTISLDMKVDAERPAVGAALPGPTVPAPVSPQLPGQVPAAGGLPVAPGSGVPRTIPTRSLRTSATEGAGLGAAATPGWGSANRQPLPAPAQAASPNDASTLPYEAQIALIEIQRERTKEAVQAGKLPPLPPITFPQK